MCFKHLTAQVKITGSLFFSDEVKRMFTCAKLEIINEKSMKPLR